MTRNIFIKCKPTMKALALELRRIEATPRTELKSLTCVSNQAGTPSGTIAEVESRTPSKDIVDVVPDPPGTPTRPDDELVCKGSACIASREQGIAVYRRA